MTENEATDLDKLIADAKALAKEKDTLARTFRGFKDYGNPKSTITSGVEKAQKEADLYKQVAKLFEELQQYRAIGTVEEITNLIKFLSFDDDTSILEDLRMLVEYYVIGTIDEFKALKEKNVAKKPRFYAHNYYCTECGNLVGNNEFEWQRFLYCDKCGQKLDWQ